MSYINRNIPLGFRKTPTAKSTPRTRFEALALGTKEALAENPNLADMPDRINVWMESAEFKEITTSGAANVRSKIINRINFVKEKLLSHE